MLHEFPITQERFQFGQNYSLNVKLTNFAVNGLGEQENLQLSHRVLQQGFTRLPGQVPQHQEQQNRNYDDSKIKTTNVLRPKSAIE